MDGMELRILLNSCLQGRKGNNCLLMPLKSSILFKVSSAQHSKIGSDRVSVPRNDRYRMMTLPNLHVFSSCVKASCYKSYNPFPLPESPWGVSHAVREINRGAELLEEVSSSLLGQSTEEAADIEDGEIESNDERGNVEGMHSNGDFGFKGRLSSDWCLSGRKRGASSANKSCKVTFHSS